MERQVKIEIVMVVLLTACLSTLVTITVLYLIGIPHLFPSKTIDTPIRLSTTMTDEPRQFTPRMGKIKLERVNDATHKRIAYLIEMLASKNAPPPIRGDASKGDDQTIKMPDEYDKSLQVPVFLATEQLLTENEAAFDQLLAHTNDDRYSYSVNGMADFNVNVSQACVKIVTRCLLSYEPELHVITSSQGMRYLEKQRLATHDSKSLVEWWEKNKTRGLAAIQVEAIDDEIEFMRDVDGTKALGPYLDGPQLPIDKFNSLRDENLQILGGIRHAIIETGEPHRAKSMDDYYGCMIGMPWARRLHNL
jgi:hypothetical protein